MKTDAATFELGNVLISWRPANLFDKLFTDKTKRDDFPANLATPDRHSERDAGRSPHEATDLVLKESPGWSHPVRAFCACWKERFGGAIEGSVEILKERKEKDDRLYAFSNRSTKRFNDTLDNFPFLQWFDGKVIGGEAWLKKPDAAIFRLALDRLGTGPQQAVLIDDSETNEKAAKSPVMLRKELQTVNLLS